MKAIECPACGAYSVHTRRTCYQCGAALPGDGRRPVGRSRAPSVWQEANMVLMGALAGVFLCACAWLVFIFSPLSTPLLRRPELTLELTMGLIIASSMLGGSLVGGIAADYLLRRAHKPPGGRAVNWEVAAAPAVSLLLTLPLSIVVSFSFELFAIFFLPILAPPMAVFTVLHAQQHRLLDL